MRLSLEGTKCLCSKLRVHCLLTRFIILTKVKYTYCAAAALWLRYTIPKRQFSQRSRGKTSCCCPIPLGALLPSTHLHLGSPITYGGFRGWLIARVSLMPFEL